MTAREWVENLFNEDRNDAEPMSVRTAESDLRNFRAEGWDVPEDLTAQEYMEIWNELCGAGDAEYTYYLDPCFNYGDFSESKWALFRSEAGDDDRELVMWRCWKTDGEIDFDEIDEAIKEELGFVPDYII